MLPTQTTPDLKTKKLHKTPKCIRFIAVHSYQAASGYFQPCFSSVDCSSLKGTDPQKNVALPSFLRSSHPYAHKQHIQRNMLVIVGQSGWIWRPCLVRFTLEAEHKITGWHKELLSAQLSLVNRVMHTGLESSF